MISLPELQAKARRQYDKVLRAHLTGETCFPLTIPASKTLDRSQGNEHILAQQVTLLQHSKNRTGSGYTLTLKPNRQTGQSEISRIAFDTQADYLVFLDRAAEFATFQANVAHTTATLPALLPLLCHSPRLLLDHAADWLNLLTVGAYFQQHPQPNQHVRNLPLTLPTKFIERHQAALRPILNQLIPQYVRSEETDFFRRFHLLLEEPGIKIRFLDPALRLHPAVSQCSVWASEFQELRLPAQRVYVIENLTTFLAFPPVPDSLAIWGGGFAVSLLAGADWLRSKQLFYWGDLDIHGFQILAQFRTCFPNAQSLLMDKATFVMHQYGGRGGTFPALCLPSLTAAEQALYQVLMQTNARLEQEKLPPTYVAQAVNRTVLSDEGFE